MTIHPQGTDLPGGTVAEPCDSLLFNKPLLDIEAWRAQQIYVVAHIYVGPVADMAKPGAVPVCMGKGFGGVLGGGRNPYVKKTK